MITKRILFLLTVLLNCLSMPAQYADIKDLPYVEAPKDSIGRRVLDVHYNSEEKGLLVIG